MSACLGSAMNRTLIHLTPSNFLFQEFLRDKRFVLLKPKVIATLFLKPRFSVQSWTKYHGTAQGFSRNFGGGGHKCPATAKFVSVFYSVLSLHTSPQILIFNVTWSERVTLLQCWNTWHDFQNHECSKNLPFPFKINFLDSVCSFRSLVFTNCSELPPKWGSIMKLRREWSSIRIGSEKVNRPRFTQTLSV